MKLLIAGFTGCCSVHAKFYFTALWDCGDMECLVRMGLN